MNRYNSARVRPIGIIPSPNDSSPVLESPPFNIPNTIYYSPTTLHFSNEDSTPTLSWTMCQYLLHSTPIQTTDTPIHSYGSSSVHLLFGELEHLKILVSLSANSTAHRASVSPSLHYSHSVCLCTSFRSRGENFSSREKFLLDPIRPPRQEMCPRPLLLP